MVMSVTRREDLAFQPHGVFTGTRCNFFEEFPFSYSRACYKKVVLFENFEMFCLPGIRTKSNAYLLVVKPSTLLRVNGSANKACLYILARTKILNMKRFEGYIC